MPWHLAVVFSQGGQGPPGPTCHFWKGGGWGALLYPMQHIAKKRLCLRTLSHGRYAGGRRGSRSTPPLGEVAGGRERYAMAGTAVAGTAAPPWRHHRRVRQSDLLNDFHEAEIKEGTVRQLSEEAWGVVTMFLPEELSY